MGNRSRRSGKWQSFRRRLLRRAILFTALVLAVPLVLTVLYLPSPVHPLSTLMMRDLVTLRGYDRQWRSIDAIAPVLAHSVMMSEDGLFCAHGGVDWGAVNTVIEDAMAGERPRGASTIPMQTVKNLFLWHGRSFVRKAAEVPLAIYFDAVVSKRRIMEIYLNIAEWAPGVYGAEAASRHYFGKAAADLTRREAALLAVTLPGPATRNPARPTNALGRLARTIERRAQKAGGYVDCLN